MEVILPAIANHELFFPLMMTVTIFVLSEEEIMIHKKINGKKICCHLSFIVTG